MKIACHEWAEHSRELPTYYSGSNIWPLAEQGEKGEWNILR